MRCGWVTTNCNPKAKRERKTDAELATEARYLNRLGEHLKERGMRLMLHQHDPAITSAVWFALHSKGCGADAICTKGLTKMS